MTDELADLVRRRAGDRCEYCLLPQDVHGWRFEIDHIIAEQHDGKTEESNLALCCPRCNRHKGPNVGGIDPATGRLVALYHPRQDTWNEHFAWDGPLIKPLTAVGRTTLLVLRMNDSIRVAARMLLIEEGRFPPS